MFNDHANPLAVTLEFGQGSNGKTTFGIRYLINIPWACAFVFDFSGQLSERLKVRHVGTAEECENALATRTVCFNPRRMFDADEYDKAFQWFCNWSYEAATRGPGRKILFSDDQWEFSPGRVMSKELARVIRLGRFRHLEYFGITHRPMDYHIDVRSLVTEWVAFNTVEPSDFDAVKPYWPGVVKAATLNKFEFLAYNRNSRVEMRAFLPPP